MTPAAVIRWVVVLLLALGAWWLVTSTEWTEVEVNTPAKGEARRNELFAAQLLAKQLGAAVERHETLDRLPPPGAVLVLESDYWDLFPGRPAQMKRWVEGGGHLVLHASTLDHDALAPWVPVQMTKRPSPPKSPNRPGGAKDAACRPLDEFSGLGTPTGASYRLCARPYWQELHIRYGASPTWILQGTEGIELVRVPLGRGTVTVYGPSRLLNNGEAVRTGSDHAPAVAAALQLRRDAVVWLVPDEARAPLLSWVWQQGWTAVLLGLAAAAAWLWRATVRFGPMGVVPPLQRRSMREQVAGTGAFLRRHGPAALHAAQARALQEAARIRLPGYGRLRGAAAVQRIAQSTGLPAAALEAALASAQPDRPTLVADLELMELARRRLAQSTSHFSSHP